MNAPAHNLTRNWDYHSGITDCRECDGHGGHMRIPGGHGNDPDNWMIECPECEGLGFEPCPVCGFEHRIDGFDCLACSLIVELPSAMMTDAVRADFLVAVGHAFDAKREAGQ